MECAEWFILICATQLNKPGTGTRKLISHQLIKFRAFDVRWPYMKEIELNLIVLHSENIYRPSDKSPIDNYALS